jgi:hypothetical protein
MCFGLHKLIAFTWPLRMGLTRKSLESLLHSSRQLRNRDVALVSSNQNHHVAVKVVNGPRRAYAARASPIALMEQRT